MTYYRDKRRVDADSVFAMSNLTPPAQVQKSYVATSQGQIHYRHIGSGHPLVLLQVLPFGSMMLEPLMQRMAQMGYECIAFDLMGYGGSDKRPGDWYVADYANNIAEALWLLGLRRCDVLGGHFSSMVALDLADREKGLVQRLILDGVPLRDKSDRDAAVSRLVEKPLIDDTGTAILEHWKFAVGVIAKADPQAKIDARSESTFIQAFQSFCGLLNKPGPAKAYYSFDTLETLSRIDQPVLIIGSSTDTLAENHELALRTAKRGRGHFFTGVNPLYQFTRANALQAAEGYATVLNEFLGKDS